MPHCGRPRRFGEEELGASQERIDALAPLCLADAPVAVSRLLRPCSERSCATKGLPSNETGTLCIETEITPKSTALARAWECQEAQEREAVELRQQLSDARQSSTRHEAEAQTLKVLVERLTPRAGAAATATKTRRKAP